ncbi:MULTISPECIES: SIMPL domain-containing protein [unclassified Pseudoalteromonas]|uniref:SIMPL domain-containing protein n=1 Tax=unclassified Pseudoalteromonas TaxID=194690 RepID=UPI0009E27007|nr:MULTISPECIES: SIMPL domain-containing protein [unclassified Pseudoalteromonas]
MKLITSIALVAMSFTSVANTQLPNNRHISVTGNAELSAKPDIAVIHLHVENNNKTSSAAKTEVDARVNNLLDGLNKFKVDESNVSASSISTEPRYSYRNNENPTITGYVAKRTLKVTLNDIKKLNTFIDFALSVKINSVRNIELKSSKEAVFKDEVNALAVKHAKEKGRSLANAFDADLGRIYSINANSNSSAYRYGANQDAEMVQMSAMKGTAPKPGRYLQENIKFSASISVVFDLEVK